MNSPQFMSLAESPAVDRMLQRVFPGASLDTPVLGVDGNAVSVDPRGDGGSMTADMGSMFQALMPIAQQVKQTAIPPPHSIKFHIIVAEHLLISTSTT